MIPLTRCSLLPIETIDRQDNSYNLRPQSDSGPDQSLQENIQKFGILQPPLLQRIDKHYTILSGRKRIQAAEALGWNEIPALIVEDEATQNQLGEIILIHAQIGSRLSSIEQALFFQKMSDRISREQAVALLPLIGLKPHPYRLQEFETILQLDRTAIEAMHTGRIPQKAGSKLAKLSTRDQQTVVGLINHFKLGGSKQQNLIGYAIELGMRTRRPLEEFILQWQQKNPTDDNRPQQATALLANLEELCFPETSRAEQKFQQFRRSIQFPENITLLHTPSFEDDRMTLSITFNDQTSFLKGWEQIKAGL